MGQPAAAVMTAHSRDNLPSVIAVYNERMRLRTNSPDTGSAAARAATIEAIRAPILCSSKAPWGIHDSIVNNLCHRCGWSASAH